MSPQTPQDGSPPPGHERPCVRDVVSGRRYECPKCGRVVQRLPTGRLRNHGGTIEMPRYCRFPEEEASLLASAPGRDLLLVEYPQFSDVYLARPNPGREIVKKPHGGQLRNPDPSGWRWRSEPIKPK